MFPDVPELPKHSLPFTALAPSEESSKSDGDEASAGFFAGHKVSILDLDKATLLQCLYKHATCNGDLLAYLPFAELQKDMQTLTYQEAEQLIAKKNQDLCFDFIKGKPIKVDVGEAISSPAVMTVSMARVNVRPRLRRHSADGLPYRNTAVCSQLRDLTSEVSFTRKGHEKPSFKALGKMLRLLDALNGKELGMTCNQMNQENK